MVEVFFFPLELDFMKQFYVCFLFFLTCLMRSIQPIYNQKIRMTAILHIVVKSPLPGHYAHQSIILG